MEEEPKPAQNTPTSNPDRNPNPLNITQTSTMPPAPPPEPPQTTDSLRPQSKKRPLDSTNFQIQNFSYFKMRAVLKDLRPHFIEVLRIPDFQNCTAAHEIREQTKLLMDLYKQMMAETVSIGNCNNVTEGRQPVSGETQDAQMLQEESRNVNLTERPLPPEDKPSTLLNVSENHQVVEDVRKEGSYVVGGSAFGWNFVTFPTKKAVYYGVTKESFRSQNNS